MNPLRACRRCRRYSTRRLLGHGETFDDTKDNVADSEVQFSLENLVKIQSELGIIEDDWSNPRLFLHDNHEGVIR